ncbi:MAG: T9SS type A sorting domain-containing protein [Saprospiraceae bacterium]|nr:T9SS type A sorting domain-containing protein [Saprospiraceae bacterium]
MKRIHQLFFIAALFPIAAQSQITIQADEIEMVGFTAINSRDTTPDSTIVIGGAGQQIWDYSGLSNDEQSTLKFFEAAELPYANVFPDANVGAEIDTGIYIFFQQNSEHIVTFGTFGNFEYGPFNLTTTFKYTPPLTSIRFPMQFEDAFTETAVSTIQVPGTAIGITSDSVRAVTTNRRFVHVDAYGQLTTPLGTFDALRSKEIEVTTDTIYVLTNGFWFPAQGGPPDTLTLYSFWSKQSGLGFPVVQLTTKNNVVKDAGWLNSFVSGTKNPAQLLRLGLSPNPTSNFLNVELPEGLQGSLAVHDMNGKQVQAVAVVASQEQLDVQRLSTGSYVLVLKDKQGRLIGFERFEIVR